jgi:2-iminobutanoate/2-iminopropanoate deaminase
METFTPVWPADRPRIKAPLSPAIVTDTFVFSSGQVGTDANGVVAEDVGAQTIQTLENLRAVLEAAGVGLDRVVKTTVFLTHVEDMAAMNAEYARFFSEPLPARSTVVISGLARTEMRVEIDAVAVR